MKKFILQPLPHPSRRLCAEYIAQAPDGHSVTIKEPGRTLDQNAILHGLCECVAKSGVTWAGKKRTKDQWKVLFVSGHAVATKIGAEMVPGLENEFVNLRESTASMGKARASSLIDYVLAFCASNGVSING